MHGPAAFYAENANAMPTELAPLYVCGLLEPVPGQLWVLALPWALVQVCASAELRGRAAHTSSTPGPWAKFLAHVEGSMIQFQSYKRNSSIKH